MAIFQTPFGDNVLTGSGGNVVEVVHNQFGPRILGGTQGVNKVEGVKEELIMDITGEIFNDLADGLNPFVLPAGAIIKAAYWTTEEVFVVTGTTPTLLVGTNGSEVTNGLVVSEAQLEAVGSYNVTASLAGTWDAEAPLAADTLIGIALGGTTPAITDAGRGRLTILFDRTQVAPSPAEAP